MHRTAELVALEEMKCLLFKFADLVHGEIDPKQLFSVHLTDFLSEFLPDARRQ